MLILTFHVQMSSILLTWQPYDEDMLKKSAKKEIEIVKTKTSSKVSKRPVFRDLD